MAPIERGWITYFVDRLWGWWCGMPGETCSYTVDAVRIPVGNGVNLAANLYQPTIAKPYGTILVRTSYGTAPLMALSNGRIFAPRGYNVLLAACRGTDPLDGQDLEPAVHESADGQATVEWMREQPWYTGSFGTCGGSYLGYTQWAILANPPGDMKAAVIGSGFPDFGRFIWGTGAMENHLVAWADVMTCAKRGETPGPAYVKGQPNALRPVYDSVPLEKGLDKHFQNDAPEWLKYGAAHPDLSAPYYQSMDHSIAFDKVNIPILQTTGWNDMALSLVTDSHRALSKRGAPASLVIGPWSHLGAQRGTTIAEGFKFMEKHLAQRGEDPLAAPVRVYVTGSESWRSLPSWPPSDVQLQELYLGPDHSLISGRPDTGTSVTTFIFDPENPTPDIGLPRPFDDMIPASYDDSALCSRDDVAIFTSKSLKSDVEVCGRPTIEIHHSSDNPHVDLFVRLSEVDDKDKSIRISDAYRRLDPARGPGPITLELTDCAHKFKKDKKIRVIIAGGAHPAYIRNLGTGENPATGTTMKSAVHMIHHSKDALSKLIIPVTP